MRWEYRLALLVLLVCAMFGYEFQGRVAATISPWVERAKVLGTKRLSPSRGVRDIIDNRSQELTSYLQPILDRRTDAWTSAQVIVALDGQISGQAEDLRAYLGQLSLHSQCGCWSQFRTSPPETAISGWVLTALASMGRPATSDEVHFLIQSQKPDGWWPMYPHIDDPSRDHKDEASTYATAWAMLGFQAQLDRNLIDKKDIQEVRDAIHSGRSWLEQTRLEGRARWEDYRNSSERIESLSLSALVIHVLHRVRTVPIPDLDRLWLSELPSLVLAPTDREMSTQYVEPTGGNGFRDTVVLFDLPWVLIATVDAYPAGTWAQRATALDLVEKSMTKMQESTQEIYNFPYGSAELEIALRYLRNEKPDGKDII